MQHHAVNLGVSRTGVAVTGLDTHLTFTLCRPVTTSHTCLCLLAIGKGFRDEPLCNCIHDANIPVLASSMGDSRAPVQPPPPPHMACSLVRLQVKAGHVRTAPLAAAGGASGVGASIANYVEACDADMVVLGSRGLHGWQRWVQRLGVTAVTAVALCVSSTLQFPAGSSSSCVHVSRPSRETSVSPGACVPFAAPAAGTSTTC
jgi:hypothetical protein